MANNCILCLLSCQAHKDLHCDRLGFLLENTCLHLNEKFEIFYNVIQSLRKIKPNMLYYEYALISQATPWYSLGHLQLVTPSLLWMHIPPFSQGWFVSIEQLSLSIDFAIGVLPSVDVLRSSSRSSSGKQFVIFYV